MNFGDIATWASSGISLVALIIAIASIRNAGRANGLAESANKTSEEANRRGHQIELRQLERVDVRWQATLDNQGYMVFKNVGLNAAKDIRIETTIFVNSERPNFIPFRAVEEEDSDPRISGSSLTLRGTKSALDPDGIVGIPVAPLAPFDFTGSLGEDRCWGLSASIWWSTELGAPRHSNLFEQMLVVSAVDDEFPPAQKAIGPYLDGTESLPEATSPIRTSNEVRAAAHAAMSASTLSEIERIEAEMRRG